MRFVVDASVVAAWILPDEQSKQADAILEMVAVDGAQAPSLLWNELRNILVMAFRRGRLANGEAAAAIAGLRRLPVETVDMTLSDDAKAIETSILHRLTAYDAAYLTLAQSRNVPLATTDKALARAARAAGVEVLLKSGIG